MKHFAMLSACILLVGYTLPAQVSSGFVFEGVNRTYLAYVPANLPQGNPAPVLLVLHGFTQTAHDIMSYSGFNALAASEGFIAVYPNGVNLSWNVGFSQTGANDIGFLNALIDTLGTKYFIDTDRIYACGMSNGGFMSYRLACELSHRIAAVASVAGSMTTMTFSECQPQRPVPVMEIHGTSDLIVNYNGATGIKSISEVIERWTEQNNCPEIPEISLLPDLINEGSRVERQAYRPCAENSEVILLKVLDGGHTWPGSANSGIGNTNRDINANTEIWAFFNRFSLSGNPNPSREAHNKLDINVFPNPASSYLAVSLPEESKWRNGRLKLLHGCGQVVFQQEITNTKTELYLSDLPAGLYLLEVWTETGSATKRLVIH